MDHLSPNTLLFPYRAEQRALISLVEKFMGALEEQQINASRPQ
jgi:hypothetical protein